ncbi:hypothetical protein ACFLR4_05050 [Bacteroidota bacterium]
MSQILHIVKFKLISFIKTSFTVKLNEMLKHIGGGLIYLAFTFGAFEFSRVIISYLLVELRIGMFLLHEFISIILFIFFITINIGNIIVSYSTLYKSDEVIYLFTKPVKASKIFLIKFFDNFFYSSSTFLLIILAVLAGYAVHFEIDLLTTAFLIFFNFFPFMFSAAALGVISLLIIIKIASKYGLKRVLYSIAGAYLIVVFAFFNVTSPVKMANEVMKYYPHINQYFSDLVPESLKYIPNNWLSESMYWISQGDLNSALPLFFYQITLSIFLLLIAFYLGKKWYYPTWLLSLKIQTKLRTERKSTGRFFRFDKVSSFKAKTESILKKEFHTFTREPSQLIHFAVLLFLITVFLSSVSSLSLLGTGNFYLKTTIYIIVFLFNALLISTLSLRFVFPLISLEGFTFWKIKTSPITSIQFIKGKLLPPFLFILFISQLLSLFSNRKFSIELIVISSVLSIFVSVAMILMNFGMGGIFAVYKEKNPIRIASSQGASVAFLMNLIYMVFLISVLFFPMARYFQSRLFRTTFTITELFIPVAFIGFISLAIGFIFYRFVLYSLKRDF